MNAHSKAKLTALSRAEMIRRIIDLHQPVAEVAAGFGISARCAYKWLARFRAEGPAGLHNRSSRPRCSPRTTHPLRVARVLALRHRKLPAFQIARLTKLSKAAVCRLLRRHQLHDLRRLEPPRPIVRYERSTPGELIHFDIKKLGRFARPGARMTGNPRDFTQGAGYEFVPVAIDDASRLAFAQILPDESTASALAFLHAALAYFQRLGLQVQSLMSDNGGCYRSRAFARACSQLGLRHLFTRPYTPRTNGKAERFIQTSLREWAYARTYQSSTQRASFLPNFLHHYNWHRPHHSLRLRPPAATLPLHMNNLWRLHR
jgi:transposase InsO family protein